MNMEQEILLNNIIQGYRNVIKEKYNYKNLKNRKDIPAAFTEEVAVQIRNYFLNYSYPNTEKRKVLNEAFQSLDNYLKNPEKLLRIVIDSAGIVLRYGTSLPKIVNAGVKALKAFRRASKLEEQLVQKAIALKKEGPYSNEEIYEFIKQLSQNQLEEYIESIYNLFKILCDTELMKKIKRILALLIEKMQSRPQLYTVQDVNGLKIGQEIIVEADNIFNQLPKDDQQKTFDFIMKMEKEMLGIQ